MYEHTSLDIVFNVYKQPKRLFIAMYVYALYKLSNGYIETDPGYFAAALYRPRTLGMLFTLKPSNEFCDSLLATSFADHFTRGTTRGGDSLSVPGSCFVVNKNRICFMIPDEKNKEFLTFLQTKKTKIFNHIYPTVYPWVRAARHVEPAAVKMPYARTWFPRDPGAMHVKAEPAAEPLLMPFVRTWFPRDPG